MAAPPSSAIAGAAVAAMALSGVLGDLAGTLPVPTATSQSVRALTRRIAQIRAPRLVALSDAAAIAASLVGGLQALARDATPSDAAAGLYAAATATQICVPISASPVLTQAYSLARALCVAVEAAALGEAFLAEARTDFADRQSATAARARIGAAMDGATDRVAASLGPAALDVLGPAARRASADLVTEAATLQPIARVKSAKSMPSTALAWALYQDPTRAADLVARNRSGTSLFMPTTFEALTPTSP